MNKNNAVRQMTRLERREHALRRLIRKRGTEEAKNQHKKGTPTVTKKTVTPRLDFMESEALPFTAPELHHHISHSRNFPFNITSFLSSNQADPATDVRLEFAPSVAFCQTDFGK